MTVFIKLRFTHQAFFPWLQTVVGAAQQTGKVIEGAKPIASSTVETISAADPLVIVEIAGVLGLAYLLFPPIWSAISFGFRGYKGSFYILLWNALQENAVGL